MIDEDFDVILTTYGLIKSDYEYYKEKIFIFVLLMRHKILKIQRHKTPSMLRQ